MSRFVTICTIFGQCRFRTDDISQSFMDNLNKELLLDMEKDVVIRT